MHARRPVGSPEYVHIDGADNNYSFIPHMSSAYSFIARSAANMPASAVFIIESLARAAVSEITEYIRS